MPAKLRTEDIDAISAAAAARARDRRFGPWPEIGRRFPGPARHGKRFTVVASAAGIALIGFGVYAALGAPEIFLRGTDDRAGPAGANIALSLPPPPAPGVALGAPEPVVAPPILAEAATATPAVTRTEAAAASPSPPPPVAPLDAAVAPPSPPAETPSKTATPAMPSPQSPIAREATKTAPVATAAAAPTARPAPVAISFPHPPRRPTMDRNAIAKDTGAKEIGVPDARGSDPGIQVAGLRPKAAEPPSYMPTARSADAAEPPSYMPTARSADAAEPPSYMPAARSADAAEPPSYMPAASREGVPRTTGADAGDAALALAPAAGPSASAVERTLAPSRDSVPAAPDPAADARGPDNRAAGAIVAQCSGPDCRPDIKISPWYAGGQLSLAVDAMADFKGPGIDIKSELQKAGTANVFAGYRTNLGTRFEAELFRFHHGLDKTTVNSDGGAGALLGVGSLSGVSGDGAGRIAMTGMMVNLYQDFALTNRLRPFIGGGLGAARVNVNGAGLEQAALADGSDDVFAYQLGGGVAYALQSNLDVFFEYRYLATNEYDIRYATGAAVRGSVETHNLGVGLRYGF